MDATKALADASGAIVSSTSYDSFGNAIPKQAAGSAASSTGKAASGAGSAASSTGKAASGAGSAASSQATGNAAPNIATSYRYTGREYDADTGLYYYRNRWYDPEIGRFISEDPIGFAGGDINLYGYVWNNPYSFRDPLGNTVFGKCKQGIGPEEIAAIRGQLKKSCVENYIDSSTITQANEGIRFEITDRDALLATLRRDKRFIYNTGYGLLHAGDVGLNPFAEFFKGIVGKSDLVDSRSRAEGAHTLGPDSNSNGIVRSLQIVVGEGKPRQPVLGYADLDCENPAESAKSWVIHTGKAIGSGVKKAGTWAWKYSGNLVWKAGNWVWNRIRRR